MPKYGNNYRSFQDYLDQYNQYKNLQDADKRNWGMHPAQSIK